MNDDPFHDMYPINPKIEETNTKTDFDLSRCSLIGYPNAITDFYTLNRNIATLKNILGPRFPWFNGHRGIVVAGGFLLASLYSEILFIGEVLKSDRIIDVDMFICARTLDEYDLILDEVHDLFNIYTHQEQSENVINVYHSPNLVFQIIMEPFSSPRDLVDEFDLDPCKLVYNGQETVLATKDAIQAIVDNVFILKKCNGSDIRRISNLIDRYNFALCITDISQEFLVPFFMISQEMNKHQLLLQQMGSDSLTATTIPTLINLFRHIEFGGRLERNSPIPCYTINYPSYLESSGYFDTEKNTPQTIGFFTGVDDSMLNKIMNMKHKLSLVYDL
jgi:hypothetical protein